MAEAATERATAGAHLMVPLATLGNTPTTLSSGRLSTVRGYPAGYQTDMPAFQDLLTDSEIAASLAFIASKWPAKFGQREHAWRGVHVSKTVAKLSANMPAGIECAPQPGHVHPLMSGWHGP